MKNCLLILNAQNDIMKEGALPIENSEEFLEKIVNLKNQYEPYFDLVVCANGSYHRNYILFNDSPLREKTVLPITDDLTYRHKGSLPPHFIEGTDGAENYSNFDVKENDQNKNRI